MNIKHYLAVLCIASMPLYSVDPVPPIVPVVPSSVLSTVKATIQNVASEMKTNSLDFLTHVPVSIVASLVTNSFINAYYEKNGYTDKVSLLLYEVRVLHSDVLAALGNPITSAQKADFEYRLQEIIDQVPHVSWIYRYALGLALHVTFMTALNKVVGRFNPDAKCGFATVFTQKVGDDLIDNFAKNSNETWSSVSKTLDEEIESLYRLIRDLPYVN